LQVGQRLVVVSLGSQLRSTRVGECVLTLEQKERRGTSDLVQPLLAFELRFGVDARFASGKHSLSRRFNCLRRVTNVNLDDLLLRSCRRGQLLFLNTRA